jgi:hypothetical protein
LLLGAALTPRSAAAAEADVANEAEPPVTIAVVAGFATAILPIVIGVANNATASTTTFGPRNVGYAVAGVGPALSPIVAHLVLGEWARAAAFGAVPVAAEVGMCSLMAAEPGSVFSGTVGTRTLFGLLVSADLFGAGVGMVDVMMAKERWRARKKGPTARLAADPLHGLRLAPFGGVGRAGLSLGGVL